MLIAHSMGSIIAYDVLTQNESDIEIDTLVTIGSPLGIPVIMKKIMAEQKIELDESGKLRTPDNICNKWYNFSDLDDKVALSYDLADDYGSNINQVQPIDQIVITSPVNDKLPYPLATAVRIILAHEQRHFHQAEDALHAHSKNA